MIVANTNLISYMLIQGERTAAARGVWARDSDWRAPPLWRSEFLSVLAVSVRADVIDQEGAGRAWTLALSLLRGRELHPRGPDVLAVALSTGLSAYDAQFVVVAQDLGVPLVTGDRKVLRALPDLAVSIEDFAGEPT